MYLRQAPLGEFVLGDPGELVEVYDLTRPAPADLAAMLAEPHETLVEVTVWTGDGREQVAELTDVRSGSITASDDGAPYRRLALTIGWDDALVPRGQAGILHYRTGNEIRVRMGVRHPRVMQPEWTEVGVFGITKTSVDADSASGEQITLACPDRTLRVKRSLLLQPVKVYGGTAPEDLVADILGKRCGGWLPIRSVATDLMMPDMVVGAVGADPWELCEKAAKDGAASLIMDATGAALLRRISEPRWPEVRFWVEDETLDKLSRTLDGEDYRDACIVPWVGQRPVRLNHLYYPDDQPGRRWKMYDGDPTKITSESHARRVAIAELAGAGGQESVSFSTTANPWLELGMVAQAASYRHGLNILGPIRGFTLDLGGGDMTVNMTARRAS